MSLPYAVGPGAGARGALARGATVTEETEETEETEDAAAERIKARVAAMVVSRPGRMVGASSAMGTRQVNFMTVTMPNGSREAVAPNYCQAPGLVCSRPWQ